MPRMVMLTAELRKDLPPLYSTEGHPDPTVRVKYFSPWSNWTWWAWEASAQMKDGTEIPLSQVTTEDDIQDVQFFGLVKGHETEMGYFSLRELESARGPGGLRIERDLHFSPKPLSDVKKGME